MTKHLPDIGTYSAIFIGIFLSCFHINAQTTYLMQNALVTECEGILTDSDMGPEQGQYNHNENYVFTICVDGADEIVFTFDFFATEDNYDLLTIYDGPDTNSAIINQFSGQIQPPPVVIASSGCMTFHFKSDDNIVASGWSGSWDIEVDEPQTPVLSMISPADCPMSVATFQFDIPVDCGLFDAQYFSIIGPGGPAIANINVLDCDSSTNLGQTFEVEFTNELAEEGNFRLLFEGQIQDACGEWHDVSNNLLFTLSNCPINVEIEVTTPGCQGECGTVRAVVTGSSSSNFTYQWSHTVEDSEAVDVCSTDSLLISVIVTVQSTGESATDSIVYVAMENPIFLNPLLGDTICSSSSDHFYNVSQTGGRFYSELIPDGERRSGRYQFWRWSWQNNIRKDTIYYVDPNGCVARDSVYISPVWAGDIEATCLNSGSFDLSGETPGGGSWSGPHVDPTGVFSPSQSGSFLVTYESPLGCTDLKRVNVADAIVMPDVDTICGFNAFNFEAEPYGGRWSGPGIVNDINGRCEAWRVTPDMTYTYIYDMNGCSDSIDVFVYDLTVGPDRTMCDQDSLLFLGVVGQWTGPGNYIDSINAYDISMLGPGEYYYEMTDGVCEDEFYLNIVSVEVEAESDLYFCNENVWIPLDDHLEYRPNNGVFTGTSILDTLGGWSFNPGLAGPGIHTITYDALGCSYEIQLEVEADAVIPDYEFCERSAALQLTANPPGGSWSGPGILDENSGLFDPQSLGAGQYEITYTAPSGCQSLDTIEIFLYEEVDISPIAQQFCFTDTLITFSTSPPGGTLTINGMNSSPSFNPSELGTGNHEVLYTRGSGACESSQRIFFTVLPSITGTASASPDSICAGQNAVVGIETTGGIGTLTPIWDNGLGFGNSHIVNPTASTTYTISVNDGCSEEFTDSVEIFVYPEFDISLNPGPAVCYDDTTFMEVNISSPQNYAFTWDEQPWVNGNILTGRPGLYALTITELFSGCEQEYDIVLPGATPLKANFSLTPNQDCIDIIENEVEIIDLATGNNNGWMDFGDGSDIYLMDGSIIRHAYTDTGLFQITQFVENELGCWDSISRWVCVNNKIRIYMPNIFTPNNDGKNDVFQIDGYGIYDVRWSIYDRYGAMIFEGRSLEDSWDGTYRGKWLDPAVFVCKIEYRNAATGERGAEWQSVTLVR